MIRRLRALTAAELAERLHVSPAAMVETVAFFEFLRREMAALQERWRQERLSDR